MRPRFRTQTGSEATSHEESPERTSGTNPQLKLQHHLQPATGRYTNISSFFRRATQLLRGVHILGAMFYIYRTKSIDVLQILLITIRKVFTLKLLHF